jgi:hypothetical protein
MGLHDTWYRHDGSQAKQLSLTATLDPKLLLYHTIHLRPSLPGLEPARCRHRHPCKEKDGAAGSPRCKRKSSCD